MKDQTGYEFTTEDKIKQEEACNMMFMLYQQHDLLKCYKNNYGYRTPTSGSTLESTETFVEEYKVWVSNKEYYTTTVSEKKVMSMTIWRIAEVLDLQSFRCQLSDVDEMHINAMLLAFQWRLDMMETKKVTMHKWKFPIRVYRENLGKYFKANISPNTEMYRPSYTPNQYIYYPGLGEQKRDAQAFNTSNQK